MAGQDGTQGARLVTLEQLAEIKAPRPERRWRPLDHATVLRITEEALGGRNYRVTGRELFVVRSNTRFVGILDLDAEVADKVTLVVGISSSINQSIPLVFVAGIRSHVNGSCSFRSDLVVKWKHTTSVEDRFTDDLVDATAKLDAFIGGERARIELLRRTAVESRVADSLILRAYERGIIPSHRLPAAIRDWRRPPHEELADHTFWSLANILAGVLAKHAKKDPYRRYLIATMQLNALIDGEPELQPSPGRNVLVASA